MTTRQAELAARAAEALDAYPHPDAAELETPELIADLIADLLHLARFNGYEADGIVLVAQVNFNAEEAEE
jgi:hypothetical protein